VTDAQVGWGDSPLPQRDERRNCCERVRVLQQQRVLRRHAAGLGHLEVRLEPVLRPVSTHSPPRTTKHRRRCLPLDVVVDGGPDEAVDNGKQQRAIVERHVDSPAGDERDCAFRARDVDDGFEPADQH